METTFTPQPNKEAVALLQGRKPVASKVFYGLLPELRARAFTVSGIESANVMQRVRDALAALPQGIGPDGQSYTWDSQKKEIAAELEPYLGEEGAKTRAQTLLRTSGFQAFSSTIYNLAQEDEDTTHLQYIHGDQAKDPTPSHEALDGIILPKDDPFWLTHTGPWGHLGCVCYSRPMNYDLVSEERAKDQDRIAAGQPPENANVIEGPALKQLRNGTLLRDGQRFDVSPPEGETAFRWHPDDLRIPLGELKLRYDEPVWSAFEQWAKSQQVSPGTTVWNWLNGTQPKTTPDERARIARATQHIIDSKATSEPSAAPETRPKSPPPAVPQVSEPAVGAEEDKTVASSTAPLVPLVPAVPEPAQKNTKEAAIDAATSKLKTDSGATDVLYKAPFHANKFGAQIKSQADRIDHANIMASMYADMRQRFPAMPANPTHTVLVTASKRGAASLDGPRPFLSCKAKEFSSEQWDKIEAWEKLKGRKWIVERRGLQVADNFRHELAHNLSTPAIMRDWNAVVAQHNLIWFRDHVSDYCAAGLKRSEALAETFSLCTRLEYQRNTLPKVIEDFIFKRMLGET